MKRLYRYQNQNIVLRVINIHTVLFFFFTFYNFLRVKSLLRFFFSKMPCGKQLTEVEKAQIESLRDAGKIYTFNANHLHRFKRCIQVLSQRGNRMALKDEVVFPEH